MSKKTLVLGVIGSDCHAVGNKILDYSLSEAGFDIVNIGVLSPQEDFINAAIETNADAILVSTIITNDDVQIKNMKKINDLAIEKGIRDNVMIIVGGTQVTNEIALEAGLDAGFGRGSHGIDVASFMVERRKEMQA